MTDSLPKKVFYFCLLLLLCARIAGATEGERQTRFQAAASAYSQGDYQTAIQGFEGLAREGMSVSLFYNLANSYAQAGQSGRAILNYERALRLSPSDPDIRGNLDLVRKEKGLFQEEQSFGQRFVGLLGVNQWLVLAATTFVLLALFLLLPVSIGLKGAARYGLAVGCLVLTVTAATAVVVRYQHWGDGVVVVSGARLRVSPFESAASVGVIQEGRLLKPGKRHGNYVLVTDETGRTGWLTAGAFQNIIATP